jgi:hypothetical protein
VNTINCESNPNGSLRWPNAPSDCGDGSDISKKGDFVTRTATFDYRAGGEYLRLLNQSNNWFDSGVTCVCELSSDITSAPGFTAPPSPGPAPLPISTDPSAPANLANFQITQQRLPFNSNYLAVVFITPNGERSPNSLTLPVPATTIDVMYGSLAIRDVQQWMVDPLWQNPPPESCDGNTFYMADNGSGGQAEPDLGYYGASEVIYYPVPYEEARVAPPAGAPALPSGVLMGATNIGTADVPNWVGPLFGCPQPGGENNFAPWVYYTTQLNSGFDLGTNVYFQIP